MQLTSSAFKNGEWIPPRYTCDGEDVSPPLHIDDVPDGTVSLALIMDDPDAPSGDFVHWVVYAMPVIADIAEASVPGKQGLNSFGTHDYGGPCPPSGTHRYIFTLSALDMMPENDEGLSKKELERIMEGHITGKAQMKGLYSRNR